MTGGRNESDLKVTGEYLSATAIKRGTWRGTALPDGGVECPYLRGGT